MTECAEKLRHNESRAANRVSRWIRVSAQKISVVAQIMDAFVQSLDLS
jgi:hypothetical protein